MNPFKGVKVSEESFFSVRRRAQQMLSEAGFDEAILCKKSFRTLRRGGWVEFSDTNGERVAFSLSGLATLRLFCSSFEPAEEKTEI